ncbi:hypothetical protein QVD99_005384 [Batrachochytrium dendrobatidis]|nr:hypothetical protein O5D80_004281 [Batrachochytrium dendrobatidis]KAK5668357.1 hypothetical protein QVD99_005384 [Batrachochytrium dendrobatidis]
MKTTQNVFMSVDKTILTHTNSRDHPLQSYQFQGRQSPAQHYSSNTLQVSNDRHVLNSMEFQQFDLKSNAPRMQTNAQSRGEPLYNGGMPTQPFANTHMSVYGDSNTVPCSSGPLPQSVQSHYSPAMHTQLLPKTQTYATQSTPNRYINSSGCLTPLAAIKNNLSDNLVLSIASPKQILQRLSPNLQCDELQPSKQADLQFQSARMNASPPPLQEQSSSFLMPSNPDQSPKMDYMKLQLLQNGQTQLGEFMQVLQSHNRTSSLHANPSQTLKYQPMYTNITNESPAHCSGIKCHAIDINENHVHSLLHNTEFSKSIDGIPTDGLLGSAAVYDNMAPAHTVLSKDSSISRNHFPTPFKTGTVGLYTAPQPLLVSPSTATITEISHSIAALAAGPNTTPVRSRLTKSSGNGKGNSTHTPRPANSFLLYRAEMQSIVRKEFAEHEKVNNNTVSKIVGERWRNEPDEVKAKYAALAAEVKRAHAIEYPDYKYTPRKPQKHLSNVSKKTGISKNPMSRGNAQFKMTAAPIKKLHEATNHLARLNTASAANRDVGVSPVYTSASTVSHSLAGSHNAANYSPTTPPQWSNSLTTHALSTTSPMMKQNPSGVHFQQLMDPQTNFQTFPIHLNINMTSLYPNTLQNPNDSDASHFQEFVMVNPQMMACGTINPQNSYPDVWPTNNGMSGGWDMGFDNTLLANISDQGLAEF